MPRTTKPEDMPATIKVNHTYNRHLSGRLKASDFDHAQKPVQVNGSIIPPTLRGGGCGVPQFHLFTLPRKRENGTKNGIPGVTPLLQFHF